MRLRGILFSKVICALGLMIGMGCESKVKEAPPAGRESKLSVESQLLIGKDLEQKLGRIENELSRILILLKQVKAVLKIGGQSDAPVLELLSQVSQRFQSRIAKFGVGNLKIAGRITLDSQSPLLNILFHNFAESRKEDCRSLGFQLQVSEKNPIENLILGMKTCYSASNNDGDFISLARFEFVEDQLKVELNRASLDRLFPVPISSLLPTNCQLNEDPKAASYCRDILLKRTDSLLWVVDVEISPKKLVNIRLITAESEKVLYSGYAELFESGKLEFKTLVGDPQMLEQE